MFCLEFGPTGGMLASGSFDESIRLWDVRDGRCLRAIAAHADPITGLSFGPDGSLLVSSSYDGLMYDDVVKWEGGITMDGEAICAPSPATRFADFHH